MRIGGIASGFDTEQIVNQLMEVERIPLDRIYQQKVRAEWQRDEYRAFNTKIARFQELVFNMQLQSTYLARRVTSSDDSVVSARISGDAQYGVYEIEVTKLATAASKVSIAGAGKTFNDYFAENSGTIQIWSNADNEYIDIEIKQGDTIDTFITAINQNKDLGITAFYDEATDSFVLQTKNTGENAVIDIKFNESMEVTINNEEESTAVNLADLLFADPERVTGENAVFKINGLETNRESNSFTIAGLAVDLKAAGGAKVKLEVAQDTDAIFDSIKNLVDKYNELINEIHSKINEPFHRDFPPLTEAQKKEMSDKEIELWEEKAKSGLLRSDRILTDIVYNMRRALGSVVGDLDGLNSLHQIGISTGSWFENGKLHINETKLRDAIANKPEEVMALFTNRSETEENLGIARRLYQVLDAGLDRLAETAGKTTSLYDTSTLSEKIRRYEDQMAAMEERLIRIENRYWAQFTAMERALSEMYAQSDWLYQQMMMMGG